MVKKDITSLNRLAETETGAVKKSWKGRIHVALVYPNTYYVGMSNLGYHAIYQLLNERDDVLCERVFLPENHGTIQSITTLESSRFLTDFDIVAFSLSFENDYPNILTILDKAGIPIESANRGDPLPLIIAGGVACFLNPEPLASIIDCFFIGEAEALLPGIFDYFDPSIPKNDMLNILARNVEGTYVPSFYQPTYRSDGCLAAFQPVTDVPERIKRVYVKDVSQVATCSVILTPHTVFDNAYLIEVARGCPHGCRFCSAGFVYRPYRPRPFVLLDRCLNMGGSVSNKIGLVGSALSDIPEIHALCHGVLQHGVHLSFSSLRADGLSPEILSTLKQCGVKTVTIAPDAGSQRLRDVINKGIHEDDVLNGTESLVANGVSNLKLYFMIGLPTETVDDIDAIIALCNKVKRRFLASSRKKGRMGDITVSLSPFIPKPVTPFQWVEMNRVSAIKKKIARVKKGLKKTANMRVQGDSPRQAFIQAIFSRGDRRVHQLLYFAHQHQGNWPQTIKTFSEDADFFARRKRDFNELLPWDFIDHGIKRTFLEAEYDRAMMEKKTPPCEIGRCTICGVCEKRT